jgi:hypothetical protein
LSGVLSTAVAGVHVGSRLIDIDIDIDIDGPGARLQAFAFAGSQIGRHLALGVSCGSYHASTSLRRNLSHEQLDRLPGTHRTSTPLRRLIDRKSDRWCHWLSLEKDEQGNEHANDHERECRAEHEQASPGLEDDEPEAGLADVLASGHRRERGQDAGADERDPEDTADTGVEEKDYGDGEDAAQPDQRHCALEVVALERVLLPPQSPRLGIHQGSAPRREDEDDDTDSREEDGHEHEQRGAEAGQRLAPPQCTLGHEPAPHTDTAGAEGDRHEPQGGDLAPNPAVFEKEPVNGDGACEQGHREAQPRQVSTFIGQAVEGVGLTSHFVDPAREARTALRVAFEGHHLVVCHLSTIAPVRPQQRRPDDATKSIRAFY